MHHCHTQVLSSGPHQGEIVDEPEYEGWSGAGWATGCTNPVDVSWLNTQIDRACVDVNEFGWLIGWVMECQEKGYITRAARRPRSQMGRRRSRQHAVDDYPPRVLAIF